MLFFSISESFTGMDQNVSVRSIVKKYDDPLSKVSTLAISGSGYESCFVTLFSLLKSMQNLTLPFALSANKIGDAQADLEGQMTPLSSIAFICFLMDQGSCPTFLSLFRPSSPPFSHNTKIPQISNPIIPKSHNPKIP